MHYMGGVVCLVVGENDFKVRVKGGCIVLLCCLLRMSYHYTLHCVIHTLILRTIIKDCLLVFSTKNRI